MHAACLARAASRCIQSTVTLPLMTRDKLMGDHP